MKAFPHKVMSAEQGQGMDLRDYFAAKAMSALIIAWEINGVEETDMGLSERAYEMADAMMEARK